jgi:Holliday junction resolvasome RuvABC DNA-binding subunit
MITKTKSQKPIDIDVSLKYICPNDNCKFDHWLFLREAKSKNFKVVCECGTIFKPKRIKIIEVVYAKAESVEKPVDSEEESGKIDTLPQCVIRAIKMMVSLGYSKKEAQTHIMSVYNAEKIEDHAVLVKKAISLIGGI